MKNTAILTEEKVINKIYLIRDKKVMLDRDLAEMYGVETKRLNEQVKRNSKRFPEDFMFQLTEEELENWMSQIVISNSDSNWKSQNATSNSNKIKMGLRKRPYAFTEQGVAMLSSVLKSDTAIEVNIKIIRIFTQMREMLFANKDILLKLEQLERKILQHEDKISKQDEEMQLIFTALKQLLEQEETPRNPV
ncbi:MAG: ORF6N domain-containing protein [Chitinophagales bacterium]